MPAITIVLYGTMISTAGVRTASLTYLSALRIKLMFVVAPYQKMLIDHVSDIEVEYLEERTSRR